MILQRDMMKRILIVMLGALFLYGCAPEAQPQQSFDPAPDREYCGQMCYVSQWGAAVGREACNADLLDKEDAHHLPVHHLRSAADVQAFLDTCGTSFIRDTGLGDIPSFDGAMAGKDEAFFTDNDLLLVAIPAGSSSFRYGVEDVEVLDGKLTVQVVFTNFPDAATLDLVGWFLLVSVPKDVTRGCEELDAVLNFPQ